MTDSRVELRNPLVAALLAYLIPGAGHLYQRRYFKAVLYSVCILGTFFYGMQLGEWRVVPSRITEVAGIDGREKHVAVGLRHFGYALNGLPALPATLQTFRYLRQDVDPFDPTLGTLDKPLSSHLVGLDERTADDGHPVLTKVEGTINIAPDPTGDFGDVSGTFEGKTEAGAAVQYSLKGPLQIGPEMYSQSQRDLQCRIVETVDGSETTIGYLKATVPRSFFNWFQMPLEKVDLEQLHGGLGKYFEIAEIFMWIAGLLNLLAIWDAFEGPAYGYGDEPEFTGKGDASQEKDESPEDDRQSEEAQVAAAGATS